MRAIILGMPGSGTSYFAGIMESAGWDVGNSYESSKRYPTYESEPMRNINKSALDGFRPSRFGPNPKLHRVDYLRLLAEHQSAERDVEHDRWLFKNPESVLTFDAIWSVVEWDIIVGVYRHPDGAICSILRDHYAKYAHLRYDLTETWMRWNREILARSTVLVKFPDDGPSFAKKIGLDEGSSTASTELISNKTSGPAPEWASELWDEMEVERCGNTTEPKM